MKDAEKRQSNTATLYASTLYFYLGSTRFRSPVARLFARIPTRA